MRRKWRKQFSILICHPEYNEGSELPSASGDPLGRTAAPQNDTKKGVNRNHLGSVLQALKERRRYEVSQI
jgi:hypothetical protein